MRDQIGTSSENDTAPVSWNRPMRTILIDESGSFICHFKQKQWKIIKSADGMHG